MNGLYDHFRGVLPRLRTQFHALQCISRYTTHAAVNIRKAAPVKNVQYPRSQWIPEVAMERRHRALLDGAFKPGPHEVFSSAMELFNKWLKLSEVVGEIGIAKDRVFSANIWDGIDIRAPQSPLRCFQHAGPSGERDFCGRIAGTVDDENLASDIAS